MLLQLQELKFYVSYLSLILSSDLKAPQQYIYIICVLKSHFCLGISGLLNLLNI